MSINDYKDFEVMDFFEDEHFRKWVFNNDDSVHFFWEALFNKYPEKRQHAEEAKSLLKEVNGFFDQKVNSFNMDDKNFLKDVDTGLTTQPNFAVDHKQDQHQQNEVQPKTKRFTFVSLAVAASIAFVLGLSILFLFQKQDTKNIEYITGNAEWKKIELPDGSTVELNANSHLSVLNNWSKGNDRKVWLKGEGFFKVSKTPSKDVKFYVITKDLEVEVLGTIFNVNTRNEQTEVFLEEGKITLNMNNKKEEMKQGDLLAYSQESDQIVKRHQKKEEIHSNWKDGVLKIDDAPIKEILNELVTIYGIDVVVQNKEVLKKEGSVAIPVDNLKMSIAILERVLNVNIQEKDKQLFIQ